MSPQSSAESVHELPQSHFNIQGLGTFFAVSALFSKRMIIVTRQAKGPGQCVHSKIPQLLHCETNQMRHSPSSASILTPAVSPFPHCTQQKAPHTYHSVSALSQVWRIPFTSLERGNSLLTLRQPFKTSSAARSHKVQLAVWSVFYTV